MQVSVDKFGRVLIPKVIRDHMGLYPGSLLNVEETGRDALVFKTVHESSALEQEGSVLVFTGKALGNIESALESMREDILKKNLKDL